MPSLLPLAVRRPFGASSPRSLLTKLLFSLVVFMTAFLAAPSDARAVPLIYTFTGTINGITGTAGLQGGLFVGGPVTYIFEVDFDDIAMFRRNNGDIVIEVDTPTRDYFFADYIGGDALLQKDGGFNNHPLDIAEDNTGWDDPGGPSRGILSGQSSDDSILILNGGLITSDWVVGTGVNGSNTAFDSTGLTTFVGSLLTLTSISVAVPEPPASLFLIGALAGLATPRCNSWTRRAGRTDSPRSHGPRAPRTQRQE